MEPDTTPLTIDTINQPQAQIPQQPNPTIQFNSQINPQLEKKKTSIKIQIIGLFLIIVSALSIFSFLLSLLMVFGDHNIKALPLVILTLVLGIYAFFTGSALRSLKKWAWYASLIQFILALIGNLIILIFNFELLLIPAILFEVFCLYSLISEKDMFLLPSHQAQFPTV